jgi:membrane fusion protein, copper/silver efflux system
MNGEIMKYMFFLIIGIGFIMTGCGSADHDHDDGIAYWTCPMHPEIRESEQTPCPLCGMDLTPVREDDGEDHPEEHGYNRSGAAEIEYWTCPMHPEIRDDEAGSCPICGMDLTPVYADHDDHASPDQPRGRLRITPNQQQIIGMTYDSVTVRRLQPTIRTVGRIRTDERRESEVTVRVEGWIEKTHVNETGVTVQRGQPLVTIYSPPLVSNQEEYIIAMNRGNETVARRARERLRLLGMPESEIRRIEETGEALLEVTLTAPFTGTILTKNVRDGMQVMPGMTLYEIADLSSVWLMADVYEDDLSNISLGQAVEFSIQGNGASSHGGRVAFIQPTVDPATRTLPVRIEVQNPEGSIRLDQYGWVSFITDLGERLSVHTDAVLHTGRRTVVFKEQGRGRFEPVEVHLGTRAEEYYEVLHGLAEGDRVVTSGRFWLDAESRLRGVGTEAVPVHEH